MANTWFVMIPPTYAGKSTSEKELVDFVIQYSYPSQAWTDANAGKIVQGAEGNTGNPQVSEQLVKWLGPYATQAEAKSAANPQQQSPNPVNDAVNAAENAKYPGWSLVFGNTKGLLTRSLKVLIGGILLIEGILKLSGADKTVTSVLMGPAGKVLNGFRMGE